MIVGIFTISGHSMVPSYYPNQKIIVSTLPYLISKPKINDVVLFKYGKKTLVKRVKKIVDENLFVEGDNVGDSKEIGWVLRHDIVGKVILKL